MLLIDRGSCLEGWRNAKVMSEWLTIWKLYGLMKGGHRQGAVPALWFGK